MNIPIIVNVAISLIFIYLILSLLLSAIQEYITSILEWRAENLRNNIASLLDGSRDFNQSTIAKQLYGKPLIKTLNQISNNWLKVVIPAWQESKGPSYINSQIFSASLLELLREDYNFDWEKYINNISEMEDLLAAVQQASAYNQTNISNEIKQKIEASKINKARTENLSDLPANLLKILTTLARQAKYRVENEQVTIKEFQKEISYWFDSSMERTSGAYKRNAAGFALLISILLVTIGNVDTIYIVNRLYDEPALSSAISKLAETTCGGDRDFETCTQNLQKIQEKNINSLPIGWNFSKQFPWLNFQQQQQNWRSAVLGWIISAIALAQGSPFWFEILNKFLNVRNTGQKPPTLVEAEKE